MPTWAAVIIASAAVITALGVIWSKFLRPAIFFVAKAEELAPVLADIAEDFKNNGGSSLKDKLDNQYALSQEALKLSRNAVKLVRQMATTLELQTEAFAEFENYVHERFHDTIGVLSPLALAAREELAVLQTLIADVAGPEVAERITEKLVKDARRIARAERKSSPPGKRSRPRSKSAPSKGGKA